MILGQSRASGEHAIFVWDKGWFVRDLASRNGTFVDGVRIEPGVLTRVERETALAFGSLDDTWHLIDADPPSMRAVSEAGAIYAVQGLLALPSQENPEVCVFRDARGQWLVETPAGTRTALDGSTVDVGGVTWTLYLPDRLPPTLASSKLTLDRTGLRFEVSRDEEHVSVSLLAAGGPVDLGDRAHHYTLLTLARARLADAQLPESARGWVHRDDLLRDLAVDATLLDLHVFRARRQLASVGVEDAAMIVERRTQAGQLRIGVARLEVHTV